MAVVDKESIMNRLNKLIGDRTDDETLSLVEDVSDTIDSATGTGMVTEEEVERRVAEKDDEWRKKYKERFFSGDPEGGEPKQVDDDDKTPEKFEELFEEVKE